MENLPTTTNSCENGQIKVETSDLDFLPLVYDIIRSIEREPTHDSTQKPRESQDSSLKVLEFEKKLADAREQVNQLPGIEHSPEEQLKQLENLRSQLQLKRNLLFKYRNMCTFQVPKQ